MGRIILCEYQSVSVILLVYRTVLLKELAEHNRFFYRQTQKEINYWVVEVEGLINLSSGQSQYYLEM